MDPIVHLDTPIAHWLCVASNSKMITHVVHCLEDILDPSIIVHVS
jgi:hypothetical protein